MKLGKFYEQVIKIGVENDPRGKKAIEQILQDKKKEYAELKEGKDLFDKDSLFNPYADTRILYGDLDREVKKIFVGIDIGTEELLLIDRLNQGKGSKIDLAVSHHPAGKALASLYEVMSMQADILAHVGVPISLAESLMQERIKEVERRFMPLNHMRSVDSARLLNIAFLCMHTAADNCAASFLQALLDKKQPATLKALLEILYQMPEYKYAGANRNGPKIVLGNPKSKAGKILVDMTGGTEGSKEIFSKLSLAGISTLVCMHLSEEHFTNAQKEKVNVVIAGHISSDTLGVNIILDNLEKQTKLEIISGSGFNRFKR